MTPEQLRQAVKLDDRVKELQKALAALPQSVQFRLHGSVSGLDSSYQCSVDMSPSLRVALSEALLLVIGQVTGQLVELGVKDA